MNRTLSDGELARYVTCQLNAHFPDPCPVQEEEVGVLLPKVTARLETCFRGLKNGYFHKDGEVRFDHLHSEQYAMFLYVLGNEAWSAGGEGQPSRLPSKSYLLNKSLHGCDVYFQIGLPEVFWLAHPVGTVLGRATYGNAFAVMQGCTVGNKAGSYPVFGERVVMCANSAVIGACNIGNDVCIGAGSLLVDVDVPDGSTVVGRGPELKILPKRADLLDGVFHPAPARNSRGGE